MGKKKRKRSGKPAAKKVMTPVVAEAIRSSVQKFANNMAEQRRERDKAVSLEDTLIKHLDRIGVSYRVLPVTIADEPVDCLVIAWEELTTKEYEYISKGGKINGGQGNPKLGRSGNVQSTTAGAGWAQGPTVVRDTGPVGDDSGDSESIQG